MTINASVIKRCAFTFVQSLDSGWIFQRPIIQQDTGAQSLWAYPQYWGGWAVVRIYEIFKETLQNWVPIAQSVYELTNCLKNNKSSRMFRIIQLSRQNLPGLFSSDRQKCESDIDMSFCIETNGNGFWSHFGGTGTTISTLASFPSQ